MATAYKIKIFTLYFLRRNKPDIFVFGYYWFPSLYVADTAIKFRNERGRPRWKKKGRATLSRKCRRRGKNCFIRKDRERNDLAIARSRMQEHRDKGRTIPEWEKRTNLLPRSAGDKRDDLQTCSRSDTYGASDSVRKANASTKLSFIKIPPTTEREPWQTLWIMEQSRVGKIIAVAPFRFDSTRSVRLVCQLSAPNLDPISGWFPGCSYSVPHERLMSRTPHCCNKIRVTCTFEK